MATMPATITMVVHAHVFEKSIWKEKSNLWIFCYAVNVSMVLAATAGAKRYLTPLWVRVFERLISQILFMDGTWIAVLEIQHHP